MRSEFGVERTRCSCRECQTNCHFMPGFLIPSDLGRMIPLGEDPYAWAEGHLLASPGAVVLDRGKRRRIPTLVPAVKADGSCMYLTGGRRNGLCQIHEIAPFGCAFFDHRPERGNLSGHGLVAVDQAWLENGLYAKLWFYLFCKGRRQAGPEVLRARMARGGEER